MKNIIKFCLVLFVFSWGLFGNSITFAGCLGGQGDLQTIFASGRELSATEKRILEIEAKIKSHPNFAQLQDLHMKFREVPPTEYGLIFLEAGVDLTKIQKVFLLGTDGGQAVPFLVEFKDGRKEVLKFFKFEHNPLAAPLVEQGILPAPTMTVAAEDFESLAGLVAIRDLVANDINLRFAKPFALDEDQMSYTLEYVNGIHLHTLAGMSSFDADFRALVLDLYHMSLKNFMAKMEVEFTLKKPDGKLVLERRPAPNPFPFVFPGLEAKQFPPVLVLHISVVGGPSAKFALNPRNCVFSLDKDGHFHFQFFDPL